MPPLDYVRPLHSLTLFHIGIVISLRAIIATLVCPCFLGIALMT
jgi:hypothetical protein